MLSEILLTQYAVLSIVLEAVCCGFHQVSSHLVKFLLIPSIFSRSAVQIISFLILLYLVLTGVASKSILSPKLLVLIMFFVLLC